MSTPRFSQTRLEGSQQEGLRLIGPDGRVLLQIEARDMELAVSDGTVDPNDPHHSMFEHVRIAAEISAARISPEDEEFLDDLNIRW